MKRILLLALMIVGATFTQAQDSDLATTLAVNEMKTFVRTLGLNDSGVELNKNQTVKLERIFLTKNKEVVELRKKDLGKMEYVKAYAVIDKKYETKINSILSSDQRVAWTKNASKKAKKM